MRAARQRISTLLFLLFIASPGLAAPTILVSPPSIDSMAAGELLVGADGLSGSAARRHKEA